MQVCTDRWTEAVRTIEAEVSRLRTARRPGAASPWTAVDAVDGALLGVSETLSAVDWFPSLSETPPESVDRAVGRILDGLVDGEPPADAVETATAAGRAVRSGDGVTLPLDREGPTAANWYVVFPWAAQRLETAAERLRSVGRRLQAVDEPRAADAFERLERACRDTAAVLAWQPAVVLWLDPPDALVAAEFEQLQAFLKRTLAANTEAEFS